MSRLPSADQVFAGLNEAILVIGRDNLIGRVNPAAEALLGTSAKHLEGIPVGQVMQFNSKRLDDSLTDLEASLVARQVPLRRGDRHLGAVDYTIQTFPNDPDWRVISLNPLRQIAENSGENTGDPSQFSVRAPDVLSHEIKNPLAAIKGAAQLLDRQLDEDQKPLIDMIMTEVSRVVELLDRMQTLSSKQPPKTEAANIHMLIDQAKLSAETAQDRDVGIEVEFDPSLPQVLIDPDVMMQVLSNLLANAIDATMATDDPEILIKTRYSFGAALSSNATDAAVRLPIEIIVQDNGPGVPTELERDIFSPFVSTKTGGQGLGLALVKKLMRDMNGRIRYERDPVMQHTRFILFLPLAPDR